MALQTDITLEGFGFTVTDSYVRVDSVEVAKKYIAVIVGFYADAAAAADETKSPLSGLIYSFDYPEDGIMAGDNALSWGYSKLKELPEFSTALDV